MMTLSPLGAADIRIQEGFVGKYYLDAVGVGTIGTGFTWRSAAFRKWWGMVHGGQKFGPGATMTRTEADEVLQLLAAEEYGLAVNHFLDRDVPQHAFDAATSLVFNLGPGALKWKWAEAMKDGDYDRAATLILTTGTTADGKKLAGLVSRRKDESRLMKDGIYVSGTLAPGWQTQVPASGPTMPADDDKSDNDGILEKGERGAAVKDLQFKLAALDMYDGILDGIFGLGTERSVREYQTANKLDVDGKAGPKTLKMLNKVEKTEDKKA